MQFTYLEQLISNPAHSLEASLNIFTHAFFNQIFMQGFTGTMWFLSILSGVILCSVLLWGLMRK